MNFNHCAWLAITENWYNTLITVELTAEAIVLMVATKINEITRFRFCVNVFFSM